VGRSSLLDARVGVGRSGKEWNGGEGVMERRILILVW